MYNPQQLFQFLQYAKNYLEKEDVEFKSSDVLLDPSNEEDANKLIAIALAEHRDGDSPSGFAQNIPGDQGRSRGPWQIYGSTWENVLREYDIFKNVDDINDALDDPGMNAIAAVIIAQYDVGERKGIDNWSTVINDPFEIKANTGPFIEAAKEYDTELIENPVQVQDAEGNITEIPAEPSVQGYERSKAPDVLETPPMNIANMASKLKIAKEGGLFKNAETVVSYSGNNIRQQSGEQINNMHKNLLAPVNIADLNNNEIVDMYATNVHPYLSYNAEYKGVGMQGDGQNVVDLLQNKNVNPNDSYYVPGERKVITGDQVNQRINVVKSYMYQYFLNKKQQEPLEQLDSVYEYIFRTAHPFIKVEDNVAGSINTVDDSPDTALTTPNNSRFEKKPGQNLGDSKQQEAAPGFLNNLEKILRVKPRGSSSMIPGLPPTLQNQAKDFLDR